MGNASKCFSCFLLCFSCFLLVTFFTFVFLNSLVMSSINGGKSGDVGFHVVSNARLLLGLKSISFTRSRRHNLQYDSPSPAPELEKIIKTPTPAPVVHHLAESRHIAPAQSSHHSTDEKRIKKRMQRTAIVIATMAGAALVICFGVAMALLCKRSQRTQRSLQGGNNKVSFDPGPDLFYLDTLRPYLENNTSLAKSTESNFELVIDKCEQDSTICIDEEAPPPSGASGSSSHNVAQHPNSSDDDESYYSVSCMHSSHFSSSDFVLSPESSSFHRSTSPIYKRTSSSTTSIPQSLEVVAFQIPCAPNHQDSSVSNSATPQVQQTDFPRITRSFKFLKAQNTTKERPNVYSNERKLIPPQSNSIIGNNIKPAKAPPPPPLPPPPPPSLRQTAMKSNDVSSLPPPPPPLKQSAPVGKNGAPLPKLKPLHWDKVRAAPNRRMVWDRIRSRSSSFQLDEQMIESLFGYNSKSSYKQEEAISSSSSSAKHVMDHKRLQNVTILMKALNMRPEQLCNALLQGNGLSLQQLEALVKMAPTKDEEEKFAIYSGDIDELSPAEKIILLMRSIPYAFLRIEVMLYREIFDDEVAHLKKSFAMLEEACRELRSSKLFLRLLEAVLKTGNRMNIGTIRGGAQAFKLDALLKLTDVKGTDGKTTLLHFVVQEMTRLHNPSYMKSTTASENKPDQLREENGKAVGLDIVSGLSNELSNVKKTASVDLDVLISSVSNLAYGLSQLKQLVEKDLPMDDMTLSFVNSMKPFINHAEKTIKELKDDEMQVLRHVREITEYYHGNVSKDEANPLRIFVIVSDFLGVLDRVCTEVRVSKSCHGPNLIV